MVMLLKRKTRKSSAEAEFVNVRFRNLAHDTYALFSQETISNHYGEGPHFFIKISNIYTILKLKKLPAKA
jgi:hypothetical protein